MGYTRQRLYGYRSLGSLGLANDAISAKVIAPGAVLYFTAEKAPGGTFLMAELNPGGGIMLEPHGADLDVIKEEFEAWLGKDFTQEGRSFTITPTHLADIEIYKGLDGLQEQVVSELKVGQAGSDADFLNSFLNDNGYLDDSALGSTFTEDSSEALKEFQKLRGLPQSGIADAYTWLAMTQSVRIESPAAPAAPEQKLKNPPSPPKLKEKAKKLKGMSWMGIVGWSALGLGVVGGAYYGYKWYVNKAAAQASSSLRFRF